MDAKIERVHSAQTMMQFARLLACLGAVAACQRSAGNAAPPPEVSVPYRDDIARVCDSMSLSGADQLPVGERVIPLATWIAAHLQTEEAHQYLARIQPLTGEPKAAALETEARRVGLSGCALAAAWRTEPAQ